MNSIHLVGRLTKDPELRFTPKGTKVVTLRIACDRRGSSDATDYFDVTVWQQQAEFAADYLRSGRLVEVTGRVEYREWKADDGSSRSAYEVVARDIQAIRVSPKDIPTKGDNEPTGVEAPPVE